MKKTLFIFTTIVVIVVGAWGIWAYRQTVSPGVKDGAPQITVGTNTQAVTTTNLNPPNTNGNLVISLVDAYAFDSAFYYPAHIDLLKGGQLVSSKDVGSQDASQITFFNVAFGTYTVRVKSQNFKDAEQTFTFQGTSATSSFATAYVNMYWIKPPVIIDNR